ncbi:UBIQUITIN-60S ribosomal protein L40 [Anaeramoeba flamelloides]|uniref:UBIQUITIN-60S ribosomal protein L40 n=1 Tax=Anaeramoeba flamelloides TaxID=1746091 RepID=A0ABQ8XUQ4_9EUKA|nr:UBIQUITIN-60S ribosomal protein L40 [Anaeramoeba flamelloides]
MKIKFEIEGSQTLTLKVKPMDKISVVELLLYVSLNRKIHIQKKLYYQKQKLDPNKTFGSYNITSSSIIKYRRWDPCKKIHLLIKTFTGNEITCSVDPSDTIEKVKSLIQEEEGIQSNEIRLIIGGKQLEDERTLSDYCIFGKATIHWVKRLRGGGLAARSFVDVSNNEGKIKIQWSKSAPDWRIVRKGLCLEGKCPNKKCEAYDHNVIMNLGFGAFNIFSDQVIEKCKCPICETLVESSNCGFNNCQWLFQGSFIKNNELVKKNSEMSTVGDEYETFEEKKSGSINWRNLKFIVVEPNSKMCSILTDYVQDNVENSKNVMYHID